MLLLDILYERARELREFILLPWELKKQRMREFWHKYGRLYIILFILCTIVAFINIYMDWSLQNSKSVSHIVNKQLGGLGPETVDDKKDPDAVPAKNSTAKNSTSKNEPAKNTPVVSKIDTATPAANTNAAANKKNYNKTIINQTNITNVTNDTDNTINNGNSQKKEIRERRLAKQAARPQTSLSDTLGSVGNNLSGVMTSGVGKALSVLGAFFSAIIGLILFCAAPVVIFYLWMKKLILPLFPTR
jgi:hypothetical protein